LTFGSGGTSSRQGYGADARGAQTSAQACTKLGTVQQTPTNTGACKQARKMPPFLLALPHASVTRPQPSPAAAAMRAAAHKQTPTAWTGPNMQACCMGHAWTSVGSCACFGGAEPGRSDGRHSHAGSDPDGSSDDTHPQREVRDPRSESISAHIRARVEIAALTWSCRACTPQDHRHPSYSSACARGAWRVRARVSARGSVVAARRRRAAHRQGPHRRYVDRVHLEVGR
jgi:hypothetical protein